MNQLSTSRFPGLSFTAFACSLLTSAASLRAENLEKAYPSLDHETIRLNRYVVSASRMPQDPSLVPSSVTLLSPDDLATTQIGDISTALSQVPGVSIASNGGKGGQTNVYIRGGSNAQTLVVVDGIRVSSRQTDFYGKTIMGGMATAGLDRLEILRGPQATLYGSAAMGGVIVMETARGCGAPSAQIDTGFGSFGTYGVGASALGGTKRFGYSAAANFGTTKNDRPQNVAHQWNYSTRLEGNVLSSLLVGATFRATQGKYHEPGSIGYPSPGIADSDAFLSTVYAEYWIDSVFRSRLTLGWQQEDYTWTDQSPWGSNAYYRNTRDVLDWQNTWTPNRIVAAVAGVSGEWSHFTSTSAGRLMSDKNHGAYVSVDLHLLEPLSLTTGMRYDDFDKVSNVITGRFGAAWRIAKTNTKLRSTVGTAFNAPGLTERFGDSTWYVANAELRPEKSTGWDAGIDQDFLKGVLRLETTFFRNNFRDMIVAKPVGSGWTYMYQNLSRAHSQGVELASTAKLGSSLKIRLGGTYMDVYDTTNQRLRVPYKPRKSADLDAQWQATPDLLLGGGCLYVADRMRSATAHIGDYTVARFYARLELEKNVWLKLRVENLFNRGYQELDGYPGRSRGYFAGVEWKF